MKLVTYKEKEESQVGIFRENEKVILPIQSFGTEFLGMTMQEIVKKLTNEKVNWLEQEIEAKKKTGEFKKIQIPYEKDRLLAPILVPDQDVICVGVNYPMHAEEAVKMDKEESEEKYKESAKEDRCIYFAKRVNAFVAPEGKILSHKDMVSDLDYEAELCVIIGKDAYQVKKEDVLDYIFGYTILNDVSARTIQMERSQWYFGKSLDGFTPLGPWIVTKDEIAYPPKQEISCLINGEVRQKDNTGNMIHNLANIIEDLSRGMTLKAGTLIATGTPAGVGGGMEPPQYLHSGDIVECKIEGIGTLRNVVE